MTKQGEMDGHTQRQSLREGTVRGKGFVRWVVVVVGAKPAPAMVQILPPWPNSDSLQEAVFATGSE